MPVYDYRCNNCHRVTSVLTYSWSDAATPVCDRCSGSNLTKLISGFAFHRSWGDSLNWTPSGETLGDLDEDDPKSIDSFMGRIKQEMGGQVTPDFNEMRKEITSSDSN